MTAIVDPPTPDVADVQRRTLNSVRVAVVPGQAAMAGSVAVVTLLASELLGSDTFAGIGGAAVTTGAAFFSVPLAAMMRRRGRRPGLMIGLGIGAIGSLTAMFGGNAGWFPLFVLGMFLFGAGQSANLQARYVGADLASPADSARAIGAVVWIGTLGAVFGPVFTPLEDDFGQWLGLREYVGPYLFSAALFTLGAIVYAWRLRPDPLVVAGGVDPDAERRRPIQQVRESAAVVLARPAALLGLTAMAVSQAVMVAVMTMTPNHMKDHGHDDLSALVIAFHIVGMFGLAPIVGRFVDRVGMLRSVKIGSIVLGGGCVLSVVAGYVPALMFIGLFFLGLGWNVCLIGGSKLLSESVPADARVEAQGTGDLALSLLGAVAAISSGLVKTSIGFHMLANIAAACAAALLAYTWFVRARVAGRGQTPA